MDYFSAACAAKGHNTDVCPCCGQNDGSRGEPGSHWHICGICRWEDDPVQYDYPDSEVGANRVSLNDARREWQSKQP